MKKPLLLNVIISDLHCGSTVGLMPPDFVTHNDNELKQNPIQKWLWDCWRRAQDFTGAIVGSDPFALTLNGDLIEGVHHGTKQIITNDTKDHVGCAEEVLEPLSSQAAKVFVVKGTECHTNNHELTLGKILNGATDPDSHKGKPQHAFDRLTLDMHDTRCAFSHHIGASIRSYLEATQFSVAINEELVAAVTNGERAPTVIARAHRHRFGYYGNSHSLCIVTPPWQALTRFGHKVVPTARCHPGIVILDWRGKERGELPTLHWKTYDSPPPTAIIV